MGPRVGASGLVWRPEHPVPEAPCDHDSAETKAALGPPSVRAGTEDPHSLHPPTPIPTSRRILGSDPAGGSRFHRGPGPGARGAGQTRDGEGTAEDTMECKWEAGGRGRSRVQAGPEGTESCHRRCCSGKLPSLSLDFCYRGEDNRPYAIIPGLRGLTEAFHVKGLMGNTLAPLFQISM